MSGIILVAIFIAIIVNIFSWMLGIYENAGGNK
jgi:hypothetical protein